MNACPDCDRPLAQTATDCKCGWVLDTTPATTAPTQARCEMEPGCEGRATVRVKVGDDWKSSCQRHYVAHHAEAAKAWNAARGFNRQPGESLKDWRARMVRWFKENEKGVPGNEEDAA